jgi:hypothetical protein
MHKVSAKAKMDPIMVVEVVVGIPVVLVDMVIVEL